MEREILKPDYQSLFSEDFYFGFRFWTIFSCSFKVLVDFLRGFSVSNMLLRPVEEPSHEHSLVCII